MPWDQGLDAQFRRIAAWPGSPLRVLAGPGTGKTFALMRRVARILEGRNNPAGVLMVTFTRTAAKDLKSQLRDLNIPGVDQVSAGTLHSFCFTVLNRAQVLRATGRTPRTLAEFEKYFLLVDIRDRVFGGIRGKSRRLRAFEAAWARLQSERPGWPNNARDRAFHQALISWLRFHEGMLVGELIPVALSYLRNNPTCQERHQFQFVVVDEYQDLNRAEQVILDVLGENSNLCVAGDDDQSVYGFKYAHPEGIILFSRTHPATREETLIVCRRCPRRVISMANKLIANNERIQRQLQPVADAPEGDVWAVQWNSLAEEAEGLAEAIAHSVRVRRIPPQDIIVLTARRLIGYQIRDALRQRDIPALSFFTEQALENEISQERFALLNLLVNPEDRVALRCWLGFGSNGLPGAYAAFRGYCEQNNQHPRQVLERLAAGGIRIPGTQRLVERFRLLGRELAALQGLDGAAFVGTWLPPDIEDLEELRTIAIRVVETTPDPRRMFGEMRYLITQPELPESPDSVRVMSLHKSKGLTARIAVIAGCIQGVLPHIDRELSLQEQERQLQEQRRLFYVAITRSSETLVVSSPLYLDIHIAYRIGAVARRRQAGQVETIFTQFFDEFGDEAPEMHQGEDFLARFTGARIVRVSR